MPPVLRGLAALLAPDRCVACGARGRQPWCVSCAGEASTLRIARDCDRCGAPAGDHGCWAPDAPIDSGTSLYRYRGAVAAAVVAGKARGASAVWRPLGDELGLSLARWQLEPVDVVTWVPTDPRRVRERGTDHAEVLGRRVATHLGVAGAPLLDVGVRRPDQARLPDDERRSVPRDAFRPVRGARGAKVLLVDDVLTTGGTAHAAAAALRSGGAATVALATLARAGLQRLGR